MSSTPRRRPSTAGLALAFALVTLVALVPRAQAAFPGGSGKIGFSAIVAPEGPNGLLTVNPDGTGLAQIPSAFGDYLSWSPDGQRIAFANTPETENLDEIHVMNTDGTAVTRLTFFAGTDEEPSWSPDGTQIVWQRQCSIWVMNANGSGQTNLTNGTCDPGSEDFTPKWSPDGTTIAFVSERSGNFDIWAMDANGSNRVNLTNNPASDTDPSWSPDGRLAFISGRNDAFSPGIYTMDRNGQHQSGLDTSGTTAIHAAWSPDGRKIAFVGISPYPDFIYNVYTANAGGGGVQQVTNTDAFKSAIDWQPVPRYPRPKSATPLRASLVVAYRNCTAPNRQHGPALAFPSCAPPVQESDWLTTGTGDSDEQATEFVGSVRFGTLVGNSATPADEADVAAVMNITDVRNKADMTDYAGEVRASVAIRITDRDNAISAGGGTDAATVVDIPFPVDASCAPSADPLVGSTCAVSTSLEVIVPGAVKEGKRAVWQMEAIQVYDGGADGDAETADNTLFARQGVFVP